MNQSKRISLLGVLVAAFATLSFSGCADEEKVDIGKFVNCERFNLIAKEAETSPVINFSKTPEKLVPFPVQATKDGSRVIAFESPEFRQLFRDACSNQTESEAKNIEARFKKLNPNQAPWALVAAKINKNKKPPVPNSVGVYANGPTKGSDQLAITVSKKKQVPINYWVTTKKTQVLASFPGAMSGNLKKDCQETLPWMKKLTVNNKNLFKQESINVTCADILARQK